MSVDAAAVGTDGGLVPDRRLALVDENGEYVNGKRTAAIHRVDAAFDLDEETVRLSPPAPADAPTDDPPAETRVSLADHDAVADWFSAYVGFPVAVRASEPSYPDDTTASGPTVVSRATLATVADWFDLPVANVRRRFRANLELGDVPAFWEDRLYGDRSEHVAFTIGDAVFHGEGPCRRCVVPARDPDTGREIPAFTERFVRKRRETLPEWSAGERFDGAFRLAVNTVVPPETVGRTVAVGDHVAIRETVPAD